MSEYNRHKFAMEWMYGGGRDPNGRSLDEEIKIGKEDWLESQRAERLNPPLGGMIPPEFDELSPREEQYYQQAPFSTNEVFLGSKGGAAQLVQPGPGRQGYSGEYGKYIREMKSGSGNVIGFEVRGTDPAFVKKPYSKTFLLSEYENVENALEAAKADRAKVFDKYLSPEKFMELRKEHIKMTNREFANYLNKETDYVPSSRASVQKGTGKWTKNNVKNKMNIKAKELAEYADVKSVHKVPKKVVSTETADEIYQKYLNLVKADKREGAIIGLGREYFPEGTRSEQQKAIQRILREKGEDITKFKKVALETTTQSEIAKREVKKERHVRLGEGKKFAGTEAGELSDKLVKDIRSANADILKMSDKEILGNKKIMNALNINASLDNLHKGKFTFDKYAHLTDKEQVAKIKQMAKGNYFWTPEHITSVVKEKRNIYYPNNLQAAPGKIGSYMENLKEFARTNPDSPLIPKINDFLNDYNLTIRDPEHNIRLGFQDVIEVDSKTGRSNIIDANFKSTIKDLPKIVRPKFVSFPANLADVKLGNAVKGWRGGALAEVLFGTLDYWNEQSKGKEGGWGGQAMANAIQNASFGILKTGDKKYVHELLKLGKEMGFDTTALEHVIDINKRDNVLAKKQAENASHLEAIKKKIDRTTDPEMKEKIQEIYNEKKMRFATQDRLRAEETDKIFDTYVEDLRAKKAGPVQLVSPEKLAATDITQKEADLPFENLWTTAMEQLRKEKTKAFPEASKRLDYEAGVIGDPLQTHIFNVPAWSPEHEAFGLFNPTPKQEERAHLNSLIKLAEEGNPEPLREYNERRGVYEDDPISRQSLINLTEQHPWLGYRIEEAEGGIADLLKK